MWHLLTHSSGVDWWGPLYKELSGAEAYKRRIESMDLVYEPGTRSLYSDLGIFLLGEVLEAVAGEPLQAFARRRILEPLGMKDTTYRPGPELLAVPDRSHRGRSLARAGAARRGPRRERLCPGRGGSSRGALRQRPRPGAVRADARGGRHLRGTPDRLPRDPRSLHPPGRRSRLDARLGIRHAPWRGGSAQLRARHRGLLVRGLALFGSLLRPHRVHRHLDVGRPRAAPLRGPAHQPRASPPRQQRDRRRSCGRCGRGGCEALEGPPAVPGR